jgi:transcriptional regulator with XRE-family HTH domain
MSVDKQKLAVSLGSKIREIRLSKGYTMEQLAFDAGMEYIQLSRIELGKINTTIFQIYRLSLALDKTVAQIFDNIDIDTVLVNSKAKKRTTLKKKI